MKSSLLVGRLWGTEVRLHISLLLLIPYALITFRTDSLRDTLTMLLLVAAIFVCVGLHELGHTLAAQLFGIEVQSIVLWPLGGFANLSRRPKSVWKDMIISFAGPLVNLLIFALLGLLVVFERMLQASPILPGLATLLTRVEVFPFLASLTIANLALGLFNLAPFFPLDGGQITRGLLKLIFGERMADLLTIITSLPPAILLFVLGVIWRDVVVILSGLLMGLAILMLHPRLAEQLTLGSLYFLDRGGYYLKRNDFDRAVDAYTLAIGRAPERAGCYISRAMARMNLGALDQAKNDVRQAIRLDADNPTAWAMTGEILMLDGQFERALGALNRAIRLKPTWSLLYLDRAGVYQSMGRLADAQADIDRAVELDPGSPLSYLLRSKLRFQAGDTPGARADAGQALNFAPRWMLTFGEVFLNSFKGHLSWALDYYQQAIQRLPKHYQVYQGRGDACRVNGALDWALTDYHYAIELAPHHAELYLNRGRTHLLMGHSQNAAQDFRQAAQLADRPHIRRLAYALLEQVSQPGPGSLAIPAAAQALEPPVDDPQPASGPGE